nr:hypothetical protein Iba_chr12fCG10300 [Ipomoea batatas]
MAGLVAASVTPPRVHHDRGQALLASLAHFFTFFLLLASIPCKRLHRHGLTEGNPPLSSPATSHRRKEREGHVADEPPAACRASTPATATNHRCLLPSLSPAAQPWERGTPSGKENESRRSVAPVSHLAAIVACCFDKEVAVVDEPGPPLLLHSSTGTKDEVRRCRGSPLMEDCCRSAINEKKRKGSPDSGERVAPEGLRRKGYDTGQ